MLEKTVITLLRYVHMRNMGPSAHQLGKIFRRILRLGKGEQSENNIVNAMIRNHTVTKRTASDSECTSG